MDTLYKSFLIIISVLLGVLRAPALMYAVVSGGIVFCVTWLLRLPFFALGYFTQHFQRGSNIFALTVIGVLLYSTWATTETYVEKFVGNHSIFIALPALPSMQQDHWGGSLRTSLNNITRTLSPEALIGPYRKVDNEGEDSSHIRTLLGFDFTIEVLKKDEVDQTGYMNEQWREETYAAKSFWFMMWIFFLASELSIPLYYFALTAFKHIED